MGFDFNGPYNVSDKLPELRSGTDEPNFHHDHILQSLYMNWCVAGQNPPMGDQDGVAHEEVRRFIQAIAAGRVQILFDGELPKPDPNMQPRRPWGSEKKLKLKKKKLKLKRKPK